MMIILTMILTLISAQCQHEVQSGQDDPCGPAEDGVDGPRPGAWSCLRPPSASSSPRQELEAGAERGRPCSASQEHLDPVSTSSTAQQVPQTKLSRKFTLSRAPTPGERQEELPGWACSAQSSSCSGASEDEVQSSPHRGHHGDRQGSLRRRGDSQVRPEVTALRDAAGDAATSLQAWPGPRPQHHHHGGRQRRQHGGGGRAGVWAGRAVQSPA